MAKAVQHKKKKKPGAKTVKRTLKTRIPRRFPAGSAKSLEARLQQLERAFAALPRPSALQPAAMESGGGLSDVKITKTDDSPDLVKVTKTGQAEPVIREGQAEGTIRNAPIGKTIVIRIAVTGNPGDTATLDIVGAVPSRVTVTIPLNKGQWSESQPLFVAGVES